MSEKKSNIKISMLLVHCLTVSTYNRLPISTS